MDEQPVACLESLQQDETIDRQTLAKDFSACASEVAPFLDNREMPRQVASGFEDLNALGVALSLAVMDQKDELDSTIK